MSDDALADRLEMLLVLRWLDEDAPEDGSVAFSVATAAAELGLEGDRAGMMELMAALGELEDRGVVSVAWPGGRGRDARVTLAGSVRSDARRLFGG